MAQKCSVMGNRAFSIPGFHLSGGKEKGLLPNWNKPFTFVGAPEAIKLGTGKQVFCYRNCQGCSLYKHKHFPQVAIQCAVLRSRANFSCAFAARTRCCITVLRNCVLCGSSFRAVGYRALVRSIHFKLGRVDYERRIFQKRTRERTFPFITRK